SARLDEGGLAAFFRRMATVNPFLDNRVNGPSARDVDVAGIHQVAFGRLTELAGEALQARRGIGAVLWGEAGAGQSPPLSRLARWAGQDGRAYLVSFHNLQAAPEYLPRSILHAVVGALTHGLRQNFYPTPLFDLAHGGALEAVHHQRVLIPWATLERAY